MTERVNHNKIKDWVPTLWQLRNNRRRYRKRLTNNKRLAQGYFP
jgi:hypothetical protein